MCLVALFYRVVEDAPVVVGANREEAFARGGEPPRLLDGPVRCVAGVDPAAGGTWLGVNERGVLVAATNRPKSQLPPRPRSRGLLARDLLACPSAAAAADLAAREVGAGRYAGCNFLCADRHSAIVVYGGDWLRVRPLPPGLHVLTNGDANDATDRRTAHALAWLGRRGCACADDCLAALRELCAQGGEGGPAICYRQGGHGTVSSTLTALRLALADSTLLHAQGPPDRTPYEDLSGLLRQLFTPRPGA
ncbi:MAG TPA: NRDE family protein [Gemmataceae bacterium]|nr:NRDE family protein [Gemmataceae bacterium]